MTDTSTDIIVSLGKYEFAVLGSYGAAGVLLALLIGATWVRSRSMKRRLEQAEARRNG